MNRAVDSAAARQARIRSVDDGVGRHFRDVAFQQHELRARDNEFFLHLRPF